MLSSNESAHVSRSTPETTATTPESVSASQNAAGQYIRNAQRRVSGILRAAALTLQLIDDGRDVRGAVEDPGAAKEMALEVLKEQQDEEMRRASSVPPPPQTKIG